MVDTQREYVAWYDDRIPIPANLMMDGWIHTHADMIEDFLVFQGDAGRVFMNVSSASVQRAHKNISEGVAEKDAIRRSINDRQQQPSPAILRCSPALPLHGKSPLPALSLPERSSAPTVPCLL